LVEPAGAQVAAGQPQERLRLEVLQARELELTRGRPEDLGAAAGVRVGQHPAEAEGNDRALEARRAAAQRVEELGGLARGGAAAPRTSAPLPGSALDSTMPRPRAPIALWKRGAPRLSE